MYLCIAPEDFDYGGHFVSQNVGKLCPGSPHGSVSARSDSGSCVGYGDCAPQSLGLGAIPIDSCQVSSHWKDKLVDSIKAVFPLPLY